MGGLTGSDWIQHWVRSARAYCFATMPSLKFRAFGTERERWVAVSEKWEWYIVKSGHHQVGMHVLAKTYMRALKQLLAKKRGLMRDLQGDPSGMTVHNPAFQKGGGMLESQTQMDEFWRKWDFLVQERNWEYKNKRVDKTKIVSLILRSNAMMDACPDTRLRRIAGLPFGRACFRHIRRVRHDTTMCRTVWLYC